MNGSLVCVCLDRRAPVALHEQLRRRYPDGRELLDTLRSVSNERMVIRTCERFEVYEYLRRLTGSAITDALAEAIGWPRDRLSKHAYVYRDRSAARHLFRVAAGLESRVVGEPCIQGQVRAGFLEAQGERAVGAVLSNLGRTAIHCGRCVRRIRGDGVSHPSLADAAVDLLMDDAGRKAPKRFAILGTGRMGQAAVESLRRRGIEPVLIVSRSADRARLVGERLGVAAAAIDDIADWRDVCDALIACSAVRTPVVTVAQVADRPGRSLDVVDLGMPRNVDPFVTEQRNVQLFGLDALHTAVDCSDTWITAARQVVEDTTDQFADWLAQRRMSAAIRRAVHRAHRHMNMSDAGCRRRLHQQIMNIKRRAVA